uniref:C2H2-type domain-containing protein n=1 Tax=Angiostrongylus cantonensis TaxID=6313 RepID=A0A0K0DC29_ANGCA
LYIAVRHSGTSPSHDENNRIFTGEFLCGHCGKTFCHAASLNRHRLNFHGDDQHCQLCDAKIPGALPHETVRRHMGVHHAINRVFTCGCCNWTFPDKKELHAHNNSMMRTGQPGDAKAIAISSRPPGMIFFSCVFDAKKPWLYLYDVNS